MSVRLGTVITVVTSLGLVDQELVCSSGLPIVELSVSEASVVPETVMNSAIHAVKVREIIVSGTVFGTVINIISKYIF